MYMSPKKKYWYLVYKPIQTAVLYQYICMYFFIFPVQLADREQDWQPCPVVMVIHINKLYIHTAVVTHICIYSNEPCTNVHVPK